MNKKFWKKIPILALLQCVCFLWVNADEIDFKVYILVDDVVEGEAIKSIKVLIENINKKEVSIDTDELISDSIILSKRVGDAFIVSGTKRAVSLHAPKKEKKIIMIKPGMLIGMTVQLEQDKYLDIKKIRNGDLKVGLRLHFVITDEDKEVYKSLNAIIKI